MRSTPPEPTRREREILDILHRLGQGTAREVMDEMTEPPSYSTVRSTLNLMEERGLVRHRQDGPRYVFRPVDSPRRARRRAMQHLLTTFFAGSRAQLINTLVELSGELTAEEEARIRELLRRGKGRQ